MKILIIGGAGFLGSNLVRYCLSESDNQVTVLDSLEPHLRATTDNLKEVWDSIEFIRGSMGDENLIAQVVQGKDIIFNLAAQTSHPLSIQNPLFDAEINCLGNLRLLEAVRLLNPKAIVVYSSSSTVIGKAVGELVDEDHGERPLDIYSANKGVAEKYYRIYNRVHGLKTVVLRFANLYGLFGKGYPEFGFINYFISLALAGEPIKLFGNGNQTRNVLFAEDAVEIMYQSAFKPQLIGESFFAVSDEHLSVAEIAKAIVDVFGKGSVEQVEWPEERQRIEVGKVMFSSARIRKITGWKPRYTFREGLARMKEILDGAKKKELQWQKS